PSPTFPPRIERTIFSFSALASRRRRSISSRPPSARSSSSRWPTAAERPGASRATVTISRMTQAAVKIPMSVSMSDLDIHDFADPDVPDDLHNDGNDDRELPHRVGEEDPHVVRVHAPEDGKERERQYRQHVARHPPLGREHPELAADHEPLP